MTRSNVNILNQVITQMSPRVVLTLDWLKEHGVSHKLAWWYVHSGWLERLGDKAYIKAGDKVSWAGAISALQRQLFLPIHVGGKTALQLLGLAHFIPMQEIKHVVLFTQPKIRIPSWFKKELLGVQFIIKKTSLFQTDKHDFYIVERPVEGIEVFLSSPERAILETLHMIPNQQSFEEAVLLMENLGQLRPTAIQSLLESCNSIKVKRLFLHIAERNQHQWLSELDLSKVNLGRGKRVIGKGGEYDAKYQLSVPKIAEE